MYDLPHELPNDLRLKILGNQEVSEKFLNFIESQPRVQSPCKNEYFVNTSKKTLEKQKLNISLSALLDMKTRVSLKYFVNDCRLTLMQTLMKPFYQFFVSVNKYGGNYKY